MHFNYSLALDKQEYMHSYKTKQPSSNELLQILSKKDKKKPKRNTSRYKNVIVCAINEDTAAPVTLSSFLPIIPPCTISINNACS